MKRISAKRSTKHLTKKVRAWYAKSPQLTIACVVLVVITICGTSYSAYRYVASTQDSASSTIGDDHTIDGLDENDIDIKDGYNSSRKKQGNSLNKEDEKTEESSKGDKRQWNVDSNRNPDGVLYEDRLVSNVYNVTLGGSKEATAPEINIRSASGKKIMWLSVSKKPQIESTQHGVWFNGVAVRETPFSENRDNFEYVRSLMISQTDSESSGNATVYVFAGYDIKPLAINISWSPSFRPSYQLEKTGQTSSVDGNVETHTFSFRLTPNIYFGNPNLDINLRTSYAPAIDRCGAGSKTSISTKYDGTNNFTLVCVYTVPPCTQPCPLRSGIQFKIGVTAKRPDGRYIYGYGGSDLTYGVSKF